MDPHLTLGVGWLSISSPEDTTPQTDAIAPDVTETQSATPKSLTADILKALLQM